MRLRIRKPGRRRGGASEPGAPGGRFNPFSRRQRLLIVALAVGTTLTIGVAMLAPHVHYLRARLALDRADKPACTAGQTEGCVGGTMGVIVVPAAPVPAASAPR
jgi:hypothetical protein